MKQFNFHKQILPLFLLLTLLALITGCATIERTDNSAGLPRPLRGDIAEKVKQYLIVKRRT